MLTIFILLNMAFIFYNSAAAGEASSGTSMKLALMVTPAVVQNYEELSVMEKSEAVAAINSILRTFAHFLEFALLGFLVMLCMKTFPTLRKKAFPNKKRLLLTISVCLLYAVSDEVHQLFVDGRTCDAFDVAVDTLGAFLGALAATVPGHKRVKRGNFIWSKEKKYS